MVESSGLDLQHLLADHSWPSRFLGFSCWILASGALSFQPPSRGRMPCRSPGCCVQRGPVGETETFCFFVSSETREKHVKAHLDIRLSQSKLRARQMDIVGGFLHKDGPFALLRVVWLSGQDLRMSCSQVPLLCFFVHYWLLPPAEQSHYRLYHLSFFSK